MPQFDAFGIVEGLQCRLKPYADFDDVIPEPTDLRIATFLKGLKTVMSSALTDMGVKEGTDLTDPAQMMGALDDLEPDKFVEVMDGMAGLHADLCSGKPSKEQILAIPMRRRQMFYQWLQTEVMSPEAVTPGGNGQVLNLPRAAGA